MSAPVLWSTAGVGESAPERLWQDAADRGWLPADAAQVVIHVYDPDGVGLAPLTARSLIAHVTSRRAALSVDVIDAKATASDYPRARLLDLEREPRYTVDTACLRDGAPLPALWLRDFFFVTVAAVAPDAALGLRSILAAQGALLAAPDALDLDAAFVAHRLMASSLSVACGHRSARIPASGSWWALGPEDVAVECAVAMSAGIHPASLPVLRHFARHELPHGFAAADVVDAPRLAAYQVPSWRVALARGAALAGHRLRQARTDAVLARRNLRRLPQFLQRRLPALSRLGRSA